jgi:DNA-binding transcriptional LysR family regulator
MNHFGGKFEKIGCWRLGGLIYYDADQGPILRSRVIPAVSQSLQECPKVTFSFQLSDTKSGVEALKVGEADFAILEHDAVVDEFASKRLKPERYILVGPTKWKDRKLADIISTERIIDFDPTDQMTFRFLAAHGLRDRARSDRHFVNNTDALAALVAQGCGYSVLSSEFAEEMIKTERLSPMGGASTLISPLP